LTPTTVKGSKKGEKEAYPPNRMNGKKGNAALLRDWRREVKRAWEAAEAALRGFARGGHV